MFRLPIIFFYQDTTFIGGIHEKEAFSRTTGTEYVNYYFTVPSANTKQGLEFWSYAVREARLDAKELENEKGVVISEIQGSFATPAEIRSSAMDKYLFDKP